MRDYLDLLCLVVLGVLAGTCVVASAYIEAGGRPAPAWITNLAAVAVGAIGGYMGRQRGE